MKKCHQQILSSFVMGVMIPAAVIQMGGMAVRLPDKTPTLPDETEPVLIAPDSRPEEKPEDTLNVMEPDGTVVRMKLDTYLTGVLLAEMPAEFELDALKAQAVVARTYALKRQKTDKHPGGAVCTDSHCCQAYISPAQYLNGRGCQKDVDKARRAVTETTGQVLTFQGKLIEATYFSCSGGKTEDAVAVWGADYPYLHAVDSPGEEGASCFQKKTYFSKPDLEKALDLHLHGRPSGWLGKITHTAGGGVATIEIGNHIYKGTELRKLLRLNSTAFTVLPTKRGLMITTYGKGHRVGMSQYGADAMAAAGKSYHEILSHYYPGTRISTAEDFL